MDIKWLGHSCFLLKGGKVTLVTDPFSAETGLKVPNVQADIVTISHDHFDHNNATAISGEPFIVKSPGEYEVKEVFINGIPSFHDESEGRERGENTIYVIEINGFRICHLGDLGHKLTDVQLAMIENIDVLLIPVGGKFTLDAKKAAEVVEQVEPRIVIPMHYHVKGLKVEGLTGIEEFAKEMGVKEIKSQSTLKLKRDQLPQDKTEVVFLNK